MGGTETAGGPGGAGGMGLYDPNYAYGAGSGYSVLQNIGKDLQAFGASGGGASVPQFSSPSFNYTPVQAGPTVTIGQPQSGLNLEEIIRRLLG